MLNLDLLLALDKPLPRYTSYPTAPEWQALDSDQYREQLKGQSGDVSLYFHVPFCQTMCLFCGCSVVLNRRPENEERYVNYLLKEIDLVSQALFARKRVRQLHFGGGTPTKIAEKELIRLFRHIEACFDFAPNAEIAIEIDPRTVHADNASKLKLLKQMGFNRVSFGVQDTDQHVQEAIRRRQSYEVTLYTYNVARSLGFDGINIDLIYGLPYQTEETFRDTIEKIIEMRPNRLALFSYAKIPWLKAHQKAIKDETLPTTVEKFKIYIMAREMLQQAGYKAIGMDHFALSDDPLALAYDKKCLQRNFQGYTVLDVDDLIGFGITAVGFVNKSYVQNVKELTTYYEHLDRGVLPTFRGKILHADDSVRRWVIQRLMCDFTLDKREFEAKFQHSFDAYFAEEKKFLIPYFELNLLNENATILKATELGELFIRNISSSFDWYLAQKQGHKQFSKAI